MNWHGPVAAGSDRSCMNTSVKLFAMAACVVALAGGVAACDGDDETPADPIPTSVVTTYIPDPDAPPVIIPVPSVSVSVQPSVSVKPSTSVSVLVVPGGDTGPDDDGNGDRPVH